MPHLHNEEGIAAAHFHLPPFAFPAMISPAAIFSREVRREAKRAKRFRYAENC
jgi:hypothetical protein